MIFFITFCFIFQLLIHFFIYCHVLLNPVVTLMTDSLLKRNIGKAMEFENRFIFYFYKIF